MPEQIPPPPSGYLYSRAQWEQYWTTQATPEFKAKYLEGLNGGARQSTPRFGPQLPIGQPGSVSSTPFRPQVIPPMTSATKTMPTGGTQPPSGSGWMSKIGGFFKEHGDTVIDGLALAEGVYQNRRQNKQDDQDRAARDRYRALFDAEYAKRAPMRDKGMELMLDDSRPDTAAVFADPNNPGGRYRRLPIGSRG